MRSLRIAKNLKRAWCCRLVTLHETESFEAKWKLSTRVVVVECLVRYWRKDGNDGEVTFVRSSGRSSRLGRGAC